MEALQQGRPYLITYETRDLGSGVEYGFEEYAIYNDRNDAWGKLAFTLADGDPIYLFEDEILEISADPPKPDLITVVRVEFRLDGDYDDRTSNKLLNEWLRSAEDDDRLISFEIQNRSAYVTSKKKA